MRRTCIFAGPTLHRAAIPSGIERCGPAAMGAIFRAGEAGYRRIAIIDGGFGNVPSIWHKEILFAMADGVEVSGASSMGALRAAELFEFGMIGVGRIYRLYRSGASTDDDEVAVIHALPISRIAHSRTRWSMSATRCAGSYGLAQSNPPSRNPSSWK